MGMATVYGVNRTIAKALTADHTNVPGTEGALVKVTHDYYEANALASGSLIEIGSPIPIGAHVIETIVGYDAMGSNTSLSLGDAEDPNRYITNTATTSAGITRTNAISGMNYKVDDTTPSTPDDQILITLVDSGAMTGTLAAAVMWAN